MNMKDMSGNWEQLGLKEHGTSRSTNYLQNSLQPLVIGPKNRFFFKF